MPQYQYSELKSAVNGRLHGKIGRVSDVRTAINNSVKRTFARIDLRSSKRRTSLSPNLFDGVFQYAAPADLKGTKIIDIAPQTDDRSPGLEWQIVSKKEFDRRKSIDGNLVALSDEDFIRQLLVSARIDDDTLTVSTLDALSENGANWAAVGDGTNLRTDADDFVKGAGSLEWDIGSGGATTAGVKHTSLPSFDLTNYLAAGSAFVWVKITSATNLTNFKLRLGSSESAYYEMTATTANDGTAFRAGWQLLRFDLSGRTTTGTPTVTACTFAQIHMTKTAGKISEVDYRFDNLVVKRGKIHDVSYYSSYPWQTSGGSYILESTADTDLLNVDADEFNLIVDGCVEDIGPEAREYDDADRAAKRFAMDAEEYQIQNPSEALIPSQTYYDFESIGDD